MKLIRCGAEGWEVPALLDAEGIRRDVSGFTNDYDETFFAEGGVARLAGQIAGRELPVIPNDVRLGAPVARVGKIVCIGLNYSDHAKESGMELPKEPVLFFKSTTAICGPNDAIVIPKGGIKTDWEVELAIVIGQKAQYVDEAEALDYVAGYCLHNDVSERSFQLERSGQWVKGKSCDRFAPLGPFLATPDEIENVHDLRLWLTVNGEKMQDGSTANLVFNIPQLVSYVSQFMTLMPGDVISTGTPAGVGLGFKPPRFLVPGDVVELGIDGLGTSRQEVVAWSAKPV